MFYKINRTKAVMAFSHLTKDPLLAYGRQNQLSTEHDLPFQFTATDHNHNFLIM